MRGSRLVTVKRLKSSTVIVDLTRFRYARFSDSVLGQQLPLLRNVWNVRMRINEKKKNLIFRINALAWKLPTVVQARCSNNDANTHLEVWRFVNTLRLKRPILSLSRIMFSSVTPMELCTINASPSADERETFSLFFFVRAITNHKSDQNRWGNLHSIVSRPSCPYAIQTYPSVCCSKAHTIAYTRVWIF